MRLYYFAEEGTDRVVLRAVQFWRDGRFWVKPWSKDIGTWYLVLAHEGEQETLLDHIKGHTMNKCGKLIPVLLRDLREQVSDD